MTTFTPGRLLAMLLLSMSFHAAVQAADSAELVELQACADPDYPRDALRYDLGGTVRLGFELSPMGVVDKIGLLKGSGWTSLDDAAAAAAAKCQFSSELAASKKRFVMQYVFKVSQNPGISRPIMRADTCPASEIFSGFLPSRDENVSNVDGVLVRFEVDEVGRGHGVQFEERAWDPRILAAARDYVEACRYTPTKRAGIKARGAMSGRLTLKTPQ
jgi:TonB family protein